MVISIKNLMKHYEDQLVLDRINLEIKEGEIFGILGPAASGKTTLMQCLLAITTYDKGSIKLFDEPISPAKNAVKKRIGVCFDEDAFFETLNIYDNLFYFTNLYLKDKIQSQEAVEEVLSFLEMKEMKKMLAGKLDHEKRRLLNLACGIAHKPDLLIVDGGVGNIDMKIRERILRKLQELKKHGMTILYLTHSVEDVEDICDRIAILDGGRILASGTKEELKKSISLGEKSRIRVYHIEEEQLREIRQIPGVFYTGYEKEILTVKSKKGRNNLIHILQYLQKQDIATGEIISEMPTLYDVFWEMTGKPYGDKVIRTGGE